MIARNSFRAVKRTLRFLQGRDFWQRVQIRCEQLRLGNAGADWSLCPAGLSEHSVIYSFGVGEDISFDLQLIQKFGSIVHAFDPTPRSIEWIAMQSVSSNFHFHPFGVAHYDGSCNFFPPFDPNHVSHTVLERESARPAVELPVQKLTTIMNHLGHDKIDLLKMDIEGAEYSVLADLLSSGIRVDQLLVEFHHRFPEVEVDKTKSAIKTLNAAGYRIFSVSPTGEEFGFLRLDHSLRDGPGI
jgi:FkbM family methyltransferase